MAKYLIIIISLMFFYSCGGNSTSDNQEPECIDVNEFLANPDEYSECLSEAMVNLCEDTLLESPITLSCRYENETDVIKLEVTTSECEMVDCFNLQCTMFNIFQGEIEGTLRVDQIFDTDEIIDIVSNSTEQRVTINGVEGFEGGCGFGNSCLKLQESFNGLCTTEDLQNSCTEIACNGFIPETPDLPSVLFDCALIPLFEDECNVESCNTLTCNDGSIWTFNNTDAEFSSTTLFLPDRDLTIGVGCGRCIFSAPTFNQ